MIKLTKYKIRQDRTPATDHGLGKEKNAHKRITRIPTPITIDIQIYPQNSLLSTSFWEGMFQIRPTETIYIDIYTMTYNKLINQFDLQLWIYCN